MPLITSLVSLRRELAGVRRVALVPTMGNLHEGHLSLVRMARTQADVVVASVFVNPLQFAPHEDFHRYPRTLERDCELLAQSGCDLVFAPDESEMYPQAQTVKVALPTELADILEGAVRPGFFVGVATVVLKLFHMVHPSVAVFGKKDYQQLLVIRQMVRQLALPVDILAGETVRDAEGLALSSRNGYLSAGELAEATRLYAVLRRTATAARVDLARGAELERLACEELVAQGWRCDYVAIRRRVDLQAPSTDESIVVLGAGRLGQTRLIDNVEA